MYTRTRTLAVVLAVLLCVPAASATFAGAPGVGAPSSAPSDTSAAAASNASTDSSNSTDYTRLFVEERYHSAEVKPGESTTFNVTVTNAEDSAVTVNPHVYVPPIGDRRVKADWVSIESDDTTLAPDETRTFEVTVAVPGDAKLGYYRGSLAFTNETVKYPGRPARPVHAVDFSVDVWKEPTLTVVSERWLHGQVKAGGERTHEIVVKNTGDSAATLDPSVKTRDRGHYGRDSGTLERSWLSIDAPHEVPAGGTATVTVTVSPPADAERGSYRTELTLGLNDPARPDDQRGWQRLTLRTQVWTQPENPFTTGFSVGENTSDVSLVLNAGNGRSAGTDAPAPSFDVAFVAPNGTTVAAERTSLTQSGYVSLGNDRPRAASGTYASDGENREFRYVLEDPAAGDWQVRVMPHSAMNFQYRIVRNQTA